MAKLISVNGVYLTLKFRSYEIGRFYQDSIQKVDFKDEIELHRSMLTEEQYQDLIKRANEYHAYSSDYDRDYEPIYALNFCNNDNNGKLTC